MKLFHFPTLLLVIAVLGTGCPSKTEKPQTDDAQVSTPSGTSPSTQSLLLNNKLLVWVCDLSIRTANKPLPNAKVQVGTAAPFVTDDNGFILLTGLKDNDIITISKPDGEAREFKDMKIRLAQKDRLNGMVVFLKRSPDVNPAKIALGQISSTYRLVTGAKIINRSNTLENFTSGLTGDYTLEIKTFGGSQNNELWMKYLFGFADVHLDLITVIDTAKIDVHLGDTDVKEGGVEIE